MVVAGHAHRAVSVPLGMPVLQGDVLQRTDFHAFAAADAFFGETVFAVVGGGTVETRIHYIALQPGERPYDDLGETLLVGQTWQQARQIGIGFYDFTLGVLLGVEFETGHSDVGLRHD